MHPVAVAKMGATIDHISNGRFALNVVAGWFKNEFDMFGAGMRPHDDRYAYAAEWIDVMRLWIEEEAFDYEGEYFSGKELWASSKTASIASAADYERRKFTGGTIIFRRSSRHELCHAAPEG